MWVGRTTKSRIVTDRRHFNEVPFGSLLLNGIYPLTMTQKVLFIPPPNPSVYTTGTMRRSMERESGKSRVVVVKNKGRKGNGRFIQKERVKYKVGLGE